MPGNESKHINPLSSEAITLPDIKGQYTAISIVSVTSDAGDLVSNYAERQCLIDGGYGGFAGFNSNVANFDGMYGTKMIQCKVANAG